MEPFNLAKQFKIASHRDAKEFVLLALLVLAAFGAGWGWKQVFESDFSRISQTPAEAFFELWPVLFLFFFAIVFAIVSLLVESEGRAFFSVFLSSLALNLSFAFKNPLLVGVGNCTLLAYWSYFSIRREYEAAAKVVIYKVVGRNIGIFFTALSFMLAVGYFSDFNREQDVAALVIPKNVFIKASENLEQPLQFFLPGIRAYDTVDDFLIRTLKTQAEKEGKSVPDAVLRDAVGTVRKEYADELGMKLSGTEKVLDVLYEALAQEVRRFLGRFQEHIPYVLAGIYFLTIRSFAFVVQYLMVPFVWLFLGILQASEFTRREIRQVDKEVFVL